MIRALHSHEGDLGLYALGVLLDTMELPAASASRSSRPPWLPKVEGLIEDMAETQAVTIDGLLVQARALARLYMVLPAEASPLVAPATLEDRLVRAIVIGLLGLALEGHGLPARLSPEEAAFDEAVRTLGLLDLAEVNVTGNRARTAALSVARDAFERLAGTPVADMAALPARVRALAWLYRADGEQPAVLEAEVETGAAEPRMIAGIIRVLLDNVGTEGWTL